MPLNLLLTLGLSLLNMFKTMPTAVSAVSTMAAGATVASSGGPVTTTDWVVLVAGAIGLLANYIVANVNHKPVPVVDIVPTPVGGEDGER